MSAPVAAATEARAVRSALRLRTGDGELEAGHRVVRQPADRVDVAADARDRTGGAGDGVRRHRAAQHDDVVRPAVGGGRFRVRRRLHVHADAHGGRHLGGQPERCASRVPSSATPPCLRQRTDDDTEHEVAVHDDLLDVDHLDRGPASRRGRRTAGGDARAGRRR